MTAAQLDITILDHIDPASLSYTEWAAVGMGLKHEGYTASVWDDAGGAPMQPDITPALVRRWLRAYRDWRAELDAEPGHRSATDYTQPVVQGGQLPEGPTARQALRRTDLAERCAVVDGWLAGLSAVERVAADYWLDGRTNMAAVAEALGVRWHTARDFVMSIPMIIWARQFPGVDTGSRSD